ncbi:MAG: SpoIIE family protein phosphatase [Pseudanabaenaceae cyanobacterium bins.68]|nr:SpoIIE family protein phosphatase [Pseudanabaenaceae cyanobacterium bins.68]
MTQILVIDDDRTIQMTLTRALKKQGYGVVVANDGELGLAQAKAMQPSLIICDWNMPKLDGIDVCREVKAIPSLANTYFILLTSRDQVGDLVLGLESGADDFLNKPPDITELNARVRAGLRLQQAYQALNNQKQILENELAKAAEYVRSLIPPPLHSEPIHTAACFMPSAQLGGDCYDYFWLDQDHFALYLLDVSGHGVGSALLSVSVLNLLHSRSLRQNHQSEASVDFHCPGQVLAGLNRYFQMSEHQDMYFTIWYGVYSCSTRSLRYASGGHPPGLLWIPQPDQSWECQTLHVPGLPVAMIADEQFEVASCQVPPGSRLYLYSDGAYEIPQPNGQIWGMPAFKQAIAQSISSSSAPLENLVAEIKQAVAPGQTLEDDVSVLEVKFN